MIENNKKKRNDGENIGKLQINARKEIERKIIKNKKQK